MREVSAETLLAAIQDGKPWLARFTRKEFDKAYQEYRERYAALFREAALADGEEGIEALAGEGPHCPAALHDAGRGRSPGTAPWPC